MILYEAPHRIRQTLADLRAAVGDRQVALGRELTKIHEELVVRPISEHLMDLRSLAASSRWSSLGATPVNDIGQTTYSNDVAADGIRRLLTAAARRPRAAVRALAQKYSLPSRDVYAVVHQTTGESG